MKTFQSIHNRIYELRGERVMLDRDLALLYDVETVVLNLAVKRNAKRFPSNFMFQLTKDDWDILSLTSAGSGSKDVRSQIVTLSQSPVIHPKLLPYAFTAQGVAMLSTILKSDKAIAMHISLIRAYVEIGGSPFAQIDIREQIKPIRDRQRKYDPQISPIYDAIENLLDEKAAQRKWEEQDRTGRKRN